MAIKVENSFLVPAPIGQAWTILTDVPRITPCMPGAELTEVVDANTYKGLARIKIGPMQLAFAGEARLTQVDAANRACTLSIRGNDTKGRGNVSSEMRFSLTAEGGASTRVNVVTELTLSGSVAQYGRGVGLIKEICNRFANEFAVNLAKQIESGGSAIASGGAKPLSGVGLVAGAVKAIVTRKTDDTSTQDNAPTPPRPDSGRPSS